MYFTALLTIIFLLFVFSALLLDYEYSIGTIEGYLNIGWIRNIDYFNSDTHML